MALVGLAPVGAARDDAGDGHDDAVVEIKRVAEDIGEDAKVFQCGQGVLDNDANAGEGGVVRMRQDSERNHAVGRVSLPAADLILPYAACSTAHTSPHRS